MLFALHKQFCTLLTLLTMPFTIFAMITILQRFPGKKITLSIRACKIFSGTTGNPRDAIFPIKNSPEN